jgi:SH3-like domain-containing protein
MNTNIKVATKHYEIDYPNPINLVEGDIVKVIKSEDKSSEWFGWHLCSDSSGTEGWISNDFLKIDGVKGVLNRDYIAKELAASEGEKFNIISESCGWYWCSNEEGEIGWVPKNIF